MALRFDLQRRCQEIMPKILVIDDDPDICEAINLILGNEGFDVASASNKEDGYSSATMNNPDLVILDVMMVQPDDGFVLAQELRQAGYTKPILMLTNVSHVTGMPFDRDDEMVPVDEFHEKPISPAKLIEAVRRLLDF